MNQKSGSKLTKQMKAIPSSDICPIISFLYLVQNKTKSHGKKFTSRLPPGCTWKNKKRNRIHLLFFGLLLNICHASVYGNWRFFLGALRRNWGYNNCAITYCYICRVSLVIQEVGIIIESVFCQQVNIKWAILLKQV